MPLGNVAEARLERALRHFSREPPRFPSYPLFDVCPVNLVADIIGHVTVLALALVDAFGHD
jgi:hypothetical protein